MPSPGRSPPSPPSSEAAVVSEPPSPLPVSVSSSPQAAAKSARPISTAKSRSQRRFMCSFPPHGAARLGRPAPARYPVACHSVRTRGPGSAGEGPDWDALREAARSVAERAYVPYSRFPVGAAGLVDNGRILAACNVENASYGLSLCAECGLVSMLHATGGGRLVAVACVGRDGAPLTPCGRCRQLLHEHGGPALLVNGRPLGELLADAFGPDDLEQGR